MHLVTIKKFNNLLYIGWSVALFIWLAGICNSTFNLFVNNIVRDLMIDESLFHFF